MVAVLLFFLLFFSVSLCLWGSSSEVEMRLATIATSTGPRAALLHGDFYVDLHATDSRLPASVRGLLEGGPEALEAAQAAAVRSSAVGYPMSAVKLLAPIPDPPKIVCVGLNYRDHAAA